MVRAFVSGRLERQIPPDWNAAKRFWDEARDFFSSRGFDRDESYGLAMATAELLENAVKYGAWERAPGQQISVTLEVDARTATVEVQSPASDDGAALRSLDERIQWIRGFQSPFEAYVERLKQVSAQPRRDGESGLGLNRIAYEARCLLDFYVTPTNRLAMSAVYQPAGRYR